MPFANSTGCHGLYRLGAHTVALEVLKHYGHNHYTTVFALVVLRAIAEGTPELEACEIHNSKVAKTEERYRAELVSLGAVRWVVGALVTLGVPQYPSEFATHGVGFHLLDMLCHLAPASPRLHTKSFLAYLADTVNTCSSDTLLWVLSIIRSIMEFDRRDSVSFKSGMLPSLLGALKRLHKVVQSRPELDDTEYDALMQTMGAVSIAAGANGPLAISLGVHHFAMAAMATPGLPVDLCEGFVSVILGVSGARDSRETQVALLEAGALQAIRSVMLTHPDEMGLAKHAMTVFMAVGMGRVLGDSCIGAVVEIGVHKWALQAMSDFMQPEAWSLCHSCASILMRCAKADPVALECVLEEDNVRTLLASLNMHRAHEGPAKIIVLLFQNMFAICDDMRVLADHNIGDCIGSALAEHPQNFEIRRCYEFVKKSEDRMAHGGFCRHCQLEHGQAACDAVLEREPPRNEVEEWQRGTMYGDPQFAEDALDHLLMNNETVEDMVRRQLGLRFGETLHGAYRHYGDLTLSPHSACVVYLPTMGQKRV
ncbi:hypothetical protein KIPB_005140, partial [Kipferlia bialata]|eukprot:g2944.t1